MAAAVPADRHLDPPGNEGRAAACLAASSTGRDPRAGGRQPRGAGEPVRPAVVTEERRRAILLLHHMDVGPPRPGGRCRPSPAWSRGAALGARRDRRQEPGHRPARRDDRSPAPAGASGAGHRLPRRGRRGERRRAGHGLAARQPSELFRGVESVIGEGGRGQTGAGGSSSGAGIEVSQKRPLWLEVSTSGRGGRAPASTRERQPRSSRGRPALRPSPPAGGSRPPCATTPMHGAAAERPLAGCSRTSTA